LGSITNQLLLITKLVVGIDLVIVLVN